MIEFKKKEGGISVFKRGELIGWITLSLNGYVYDSVQVYDAEINKKLDELNGVSND